jgi:activator of 2-hydroxyglutaryl-CoA dehydratase
MKCLQIKKRMIHQIQLNEACSSGDESLLNFFAIVLFTKNPNDLESRLRSTTGDISCCLPYSVINNTLIKVIKLLNSFLIGKKLLFKEI